MDTNEKLNKLEREENLKNLRLWGGSLLALSFALTLMFHYLYNEDWTHKVVSGTVNKMVSQPSDTGMHFVIEIDIGGNVVLVSEFYPPETAPGDQVQVRVSSNANGTKNKYFRLREPRT